MNTSNQTAPFLHDDFRTSTIMLCVCTALLPGVIAMCYELGWRVLQQLVIAAIFCVLIEAIFLSIRKQPVRNRLADFSAILTGLLIALSIPPTLSWPLVLLAALVGIGFTKHLYGGLGNNPLNPAMMAYVFLLISFPQQMTTWELPKLIPETVDTLTMATPLDKMKTGLTLNQTATELDDIGFWLWVNIGFLIGGIFLLYKKIITWAIPLTMLLTLGVISGIFYLLDNTYYASPIFHLFSGATMLGAFFIATDPVTAATSFRGKLIFGFGVGLLTYIIRTWGGYPDGVAFAVLLMNLCAPSIDYLTKPKPYGY